MNRTLRAVKEFVRPGSVHHTSLPPLDAGLRPNDRLDDAVALTVPGRHEPDDVIILPSGEVTFTAGSDVVAWTGDDTRILASLGGVTGPIARRDQELLVAVEGRGIVAVGPSGATGDVCTAAEVQRCVTDLAVLPDGRLLVAVGSREVAADGWARELVAGRSTGRLMIVDGARVGVVADGLPWPSGLWADSPTSVLVALSHAHRIERRETAALGRGRVVLERMPFYPGRIRAGGGGWWVAVPFLRNRATELILSEPDMRDDIVASVDEGQWLVPSLRRENIYLDPLQMGQLRVLGVLKPWAPPRSYGLVFLLGTDGRVVESQHSRVDGQRHGITGVAEGGGRVVVAGKGCRTLLGLRRD